MTVPYALKQRVRKLYQGRCGYCGKSEQAIGGELEVDHFQPQSRGGRDALDNLVYCCTTCNRAKSDFWRPGSDESVFQLLHPQHDSLEDHAELLDDGQLRGLTARGWLHIDVLHLNRIQLELN